MNPHPHRRILYTETVIQARVRELGAQISRDYAGKELIMAAVLKGSLYFFADLTRAIDIPIQLDFIAIGNYQSSVPNQGVVRFTKDLDIDIEGKHILLVEDIIRTGLTTAYLVQTLATRKPASINVCTLLVNPEQQLINVPIAYQGFEITLTRLIGYGMDVNEHGRNLPYIAELAARQN